MRAISLWLAVALLAVGASGQIIIDDPVVRGSASNVLSGSIRPAGVPEYNKDDPGDLRLHDGVTAGGHKVGLSLAEIQADGDERWLKLDNSGAPTSEIEIIYPEQGLTLRPPQDFLPWTGHIKISTDQGHAADNTSGDIILELGEGAYQDGRLIVTNDSGDVEAHIYGTLDISGERVSSMAFEDAGDYTPTADLGDAATSTVASIRSGLLTEDGDANALTNWPNSQAVSWDGSYATNAILSYTNGGLQIVDLTGDSVTNLSVATPPDTNLVWALEAYLTWDGGGTVSVDTNDVAWPVAVGSVESNALSIFNFRYVPGHGSYGWEVSE
jgi:hypothetical protein